jgi:hypothetical protein
MKVVLCTQNESLVVNVQGFRREPHLVDLGNNLHEVCEGVRIVGFVHRVIPFTTLLVGFSAIQFLNGDRNIDLFL